MGRVEVKSRRGVNPRPPTVYPLPSPTALGLEPGHLSPRAHMVWCTSIIVHSIHPVKGPPERRTGGLKASRRGPLGQDRKSTRLNSSHVKISYAVFCLKKKIFMQAGRTYTMLTDTVP